MNLGGPPVVLGRPVHIRAPPIDTARREENKQIQAMHDLSSSGRLGPMVTCTLKLGISILNGGNVQVQQVRLSVFAFLIFNYLFYRQQMNRLDCSRVWSGAGCFDVFFFTLSHPENAWLPEREKRCGLLQEPLGTDAVLQVPYISTGPPLLSGHQFGFDLWIVFLLSVLDLNAFERQNKAEGLGMVTEEGSSKLRGIFMDVRVSKQWVFPFQFQL